MQLFDGVQAAAVRLLHAMYEDDGLRQGVLTTAGRARTAPELSSIVGDPQGGAKDTWQLEKMKVSKVHRQPRRALFTLLRVSRAWCLRRKESRAESMHLQKSSPELPPGRADQRCTCSSRSRGQAQQSSVTGPNGWRHRAGHRRE